MVDLYGADQELAGSLRTGPSQLARIIADVCVREILTNPIRAARAIDAVSPTPTDPDDIGDLIRGFVDDLRG